MTLGPRFGSLHSSRNREAEKEQSKERSADVSGVPDWVNRLSRPVPVSPRQDAFCFPNESRSLTRPGSTYATSKGKAAQQALASLQLAFPSDSISGSRRNPRGAQASCRLTPRQHTPATWLDRSSGAERPHQEEARDSSTHSQLHPRSFGIAAAQRPTTAPVSENAAPQPLRPHHKGGLNRTQSPNTAAWNLEAIRLQLARLQAANCDSRPAKPSIPAESPTAASKQHSKFISAYRPSTANARHQQAGVLAPALSHPCSPPAAFNDENRNDGMQGQQQDQATLQQQQCRVRRPSFEAVAAKRFAKPLIIARPATAKPASSTPPADAPAILSARVSRPPRIPVISLPEEKPAQTPARGPSDQDEAQASTLTRRTPDTMSTSTSSGEDTCTNGSTRPPSLRRTTGSQSGICTEPAAAARPLPEAMGVSPPVAVAMDTPLNTVQPPFTPRVKASQQQPAAAPTDDAAPEWADEVPGYSVGQVIGVGGFCKVRLGVEEASGQQVAFKIVEKSQALQADQNMKWKVGREIGIVRQLDHPRINKLLAVVDTPERMFIVLDHVAGGSLLDKVRAKKRLPEPEAARLLTQAADGLMYCHSNQCVHRDIKLENLLLDKQGSLQIIDFGLAAVWSPGKLLRMHCGSPSYAAPEIVARRLYEGPPVDVWSLGVVLFAMLCGRLPFAAPKSNKQELCAKILRGTYNVPDYVSAEAKDLLAGMLTLEPSQRITLTQVMNHPWLQSVRRHTV